MLEHGALANKSTIDDIQVENIDIIDEGGASNEETDEEDEDYVQRDSEEEDDSNESDLNEASWLYDDLEGPDDDIFNTDKSKI
ncbi:hypothetical protein M5689_000866 [Euphorbia peplus]|nr:hypothetical protein M5689_000866 [Euphorbia peplus]